MYSDFPKIKVMFDNFLPKPAIRLIIFLCLSFVIGLQPAAALQEANDVTLSINAGFDGQYKRGDWVPVYISAANVGNSIEGKLRIITGSAAIGTDVRYDTPISLPSQSNKRIVTYVFLPDLTDTVTVTLSGSDGQEVARAVSNRLNTLDKDTILYGVISPQPDELGFLDTMTGSRRAAAIAVLDLVDLPETPAAWNALDVLILNDVDASPLTPAQRSALLRWINLGGQLVVTGGPGWQQTAAPLADLLPVTITDVRTAADLPALSQATNTPFRDAGPYVVAVSSLRSGELIYHQDNLPLLARQDWGRGSSYFLALDPQLAPLADWDGNPILWSHVAGRVPPSPFWSQAPRNGYAAANAVASLPSLTLPSITQLILFLLAYVLIIGPGNYFFLKRRKRLELAWVTIPALILLFSGAAYVTGFQIKGNETIINQMSVAFGQANGDSLRVQTLIGLYSPRRSIYNLTVPAETLLRPFDNRSGDLNGGGSVDAIERAQDVTARTVGVDVSDVETFIAASYAEMPPLSGAVELHVTGETAQLTLQVQNNSNFTLETTSLLFGSSIFALGDLPPGSSQNFSFAMTQTASGTSAPPSASPGIYYAPSTSPLSSNYETLLGAGNFYDDPDLYPRWQLLESLSPTSGFDLGDVPQNTATLIGWSTAAQIDVMLNRSQSKRQSTTLYFIELPVSEHIADSQHVTVPRAMWSWQLLDESGVYQATPDDLFLSSGWVEFEYQPWPAFQGLAAREMQLLLLVSSDQSALSPPQVRLWDWQEEIWTAAGDIQWGLTSIPNFAPYVSADNRVRIRLQYDDPANGLHIMGVYPILSGALP